MLLWIQSEIDINTYFGCNAKPKQVGEVFDASEHEQLLSEIHVPLPLQTAGFVDNFP
jgi:hypothetical protein